MRATKPKWYLTTKEVAYILDICTSTVRAYCYRGILTAYTDTGRRILVSSRELITKMNQYDQDYDAYRAIMATSGWREVTREQSHYAESGTILTVRVHHKVYERWHNPIDHAAIPQIIMDQCYCKRICIVPMGDVDLDISGGNRNVERTA